MLDKKYREDISDAISELDNKIDKYEAQIRFIEDMDFSKPVDEYTWHQLCKTPLKSSGLLGALVKNIFPEAENINVGSNYVFFTLLGFDVQIPTTDDFCINVDTRWYQEDVGEPKLEYSSTVQTLKEYFELIDNKASWYECAKKRLTYGEVAPKWFMFFAWWGRYKWKDPHRELFEKTLKRETEQYEKNLKLYRENRAKINKKVEALFNELLPVINKFSSKHKKYCTEHFCYSPFTIEDIRKIEVGNKIPKI